MGRSSNTTRQRRKPGLGEKGKKAQIDIRKEDVNKSTNCLQNLCFVLTALICVGSAFLGYAYASSPISSVIVLDSHDATDIIWNRKYNSNLQNGRKVLTELLGPESIAVDQQGNWYAGLSDGRLIKVTNPGSPSEAVVDMTHGVAYTADAGRSLKRPLGLRIFQQKLYVADAYQGIFSVDLKTQAWEKVIGFNDVSPELQFVNDLTISEGGDIYFTDVCARWQYSQMAYTVLEGRCTGRVYRISRNTTTIKLIKDNLCSPNGIEITRDEAKLLVSEVARRRISVIDIASTMIEKKILLHGGADNIRRSPSGGYWVPIPTLSHWAERYLERYPIIRDIAGKILGSNAMSLVNIMHQGTIIKLNEELEIQEIHQDSSGKVARTITQVQEYEPGKLLLGSFTEAGIVKIDKLLPPYRGDTPSPPGH